MDALPRRSPGPFPHAGEYPAAGARSRAPDASAVWPSAIIDAPQSIVGPKKNPRRQGAGA